ncbi:hypothetical protein MNBD_BACTEROID07-1024 [hydrothermal vent metagenome]|uniref:Flippase-like domain-containing protein n=1 Tax=hydrothermal vent metagenome TaxID=652676 RepID=A0A3B0UUX6_9ZZZZ
MNSTKQKILATITLIFTVIGIGLYLSNNQSLLLSLENIPISYILILLVIQVLLLIMNGLFLKALTLKFNIHLKMTEWFGLAVVTTMCNYITPFSGGLLFRATYLKHQHSFSFTKFASLLSANYLINFWTIGVMGACSILLVDPTGTNKMVLLFFLMVAFVISIVALLPVRKIPGNSKLNRIVNSSLEGWLLIKRDKGLLTKLVSYTLANIMLNALAFWVACSALGFTISLFASVIISLVAAFSIVIKITPANLGIHEAIIGFAAPLVGIGAGEGLMTALVIRGTGIIVIFLLGILFSYLLTKQLKINVSAKYRKPNRTQ